MNKYETIFVVDSLLKPDEIESIITKYQRFISANGGQIQDIEPWGKKRLSFEIKKRQYGYYVLIRFEGPAMMIKQLEREYRLNESVLRFMTLRLSKQALKSMENAQKKVTKPAASTQPPEKKQPEPAEQEPKEQAPAKEPVAETAQESEQEQGQEQEQEQEQQPELEKEKEQAPEEKKAEE